MKKIISLILVSAAIAYYLFAQGIQKDLIEKAQSDFSSANWNSAALEFQTAISEGDTTCANFVNAAVSFYLAESLPESLAYFRKYELHCGVDSTSSDYIERIKTALDGQPNTRSPKKSWVELLGTKRTLCLSLTIWCLIWIAIIYKQPRAIYPLVLSFLALVYTSSRYYFLDSSWDSFPLFSENGVRVVLKDNYGVKVAPSDNSDKIWDLAKGSEVKAINSTNGWCNVTLPGQRRGWISCKELIEID